MATTERSHSFFHILFVCVAVTLAGYFGFAAIQGEYGLFERVRLEAERSMLEEKLAQKTVEVEAMRNKTRRLSDDYLDLDLLDERTRDVLGLVRADEMVIQ